MKNIKVLIIDDHKMIRDGLRVMLETTKETYRFIIDEAENGEEGIEKTKKNNYDIILLDYRLPGRNGADTAKIIMRKRSHSKIIALSNYQEYIYVDDMINTGQVKGYILKNITPDELVKSIETVLAGGSYFSNEIVMNLLKRRKKQENVDTQEKKYAEILSEREIEIMKLIADDNTTGEIAEKLDISKRTVDRHRQNIMVKLNVKTMIGLIKAALLVTSQTV